jgi:uncharacterized protein (UPF0276 family)
VIWSPGNNALPVANGSSSHATSPVVTTAPMNHLTRESPGFGLGPRPAHYAELLDERAPLDWREIIPENFMVDGGKPMAMHGAALSIGSDEAVDRLYLARLKALADCIDPLWFSDHPCRTGFNGRNSHDLLPLPWSEESARLLVREIGQVRHEPGRRLVLEDVSGCLGYGMPDATEWDFIRAVADEADCPLLLDANNIYVSSVNHGFDPLDFLHAMPANRIQQIHLAGHSKHEGHPDDTHDHPVCEAVWALYDIAFGMFGKVARMIERDDHIPVLPELQEELDRARRIAIRAEPFERAVARTRSPACSRNSSSTCTTGRTTFWIRWPTPAVWRTPTARASISMLTASACSTRSRTVSTRPGRGWATGASNPPHWPGSPTTRPAGSACGPSATASPKGWVRHVAGRS